MPTAKFLHAADLHLGSPLKSLGEALDESTRDYIKSRVNLAFDRLVDTAIQEQVDFVVLAGDVYDMADRDPAAQRRFLVGLRRLEVEGIRVFVSHGNHDPLTSEIGHLRLPDNVVVFPPGRLGIESITMRNGVEVTVAGVSYGKTNETKNLVPLFDNLSGRTIVGVLHTNIGGNPDHDNYAPSTVAELDASPVNYWALGHIHIRSVNRTRNGWWAYPGNLQGRSVKAAECGPKGVLIVEVADSGEILEPRFVECAAVRFERVRVPIDAAEAVTDVNDIVNEALRTVVEDSSGVPALVRVELVGATPHEVLRDPSSRTWDDLATTIVTEGNIVLGEGAIVKLRTSCTPRIDLVAERQRETLLGNVLRAVDAAEVDQSVRDGAIAILANALGANR